MNCNRKGDFGQCLYQLEVKISTVDEDPEKKNDVDRSTVYTKCTDAGIVPKCLPGSECVDDDCTLCKDIVS